MHLFISWPERQPADFESAIREAIDNNQAHGWTRDHEDYRWNQWERDKRLRIRENRNPLEFAILGANRELPPTEFYHTYFAPVIGMVVSCLPGQLIEVKIDLTVLDLPE